MLLSCSVARYAMPTATIAAVPITITLTGARFWYRNEKKAIAAARAQLVHSIRAAEIKGRSRSGVDLITPIEMESDDTSLQTIMIKKTHKKTVLEEIKYADTRHAAQPEKEKKAIDPFLICREILRYATQPVIDAATPNRISKKRSCSVSVIRTST